MDMLQTMVQMMNSGRNPMQMMHQMAINNNPQARMVMQMVQGKSPAELEQIARNMAAERGINIEQLAQSMGLKMQGR